MRGIVICRDKSRREYYRLLIEQYNPPNSGEWLYFESTDHALDTLASDVPAWRKRCLVLCLLGGESLNDLKRWVGLGFQRAYVEIVDDQPGDAFEALDAGAFFAYTFWIARSDRIWKSLCKAENPDVSAIAGPPLVDEHFARWPKANWGFMSQTWEVGTPQWSNFEYAIRPVVQRLGYDLADLREHPGRGKDVRQKILGEIESRQVVVAQISPGSDCSMFELGAAFALKKDVILIHRDDPGVRVSKIPSVLQGLDRVDYTTMTDLAMQLYFRLGGADALRNANGTRS